MLMMLETSASAEASGPQGTYEHCMPPQIWQQPCGWMVMMMSVVLQEGDYGCSRDEMAAALVDVSEGRIPKDRIALRALYTDLKEWPFVGSEAELNEEGSSANYGGITNTGF